MSIFEDLGAWVEDQVSIPNLLRLASGAVLVDGAGFVTEIVNNIPGSQVSVIGPATRSLLVALPGLVEGKDLKEALVSEYAYQLRRAVTAYVANAGGNQALIDKAKDLFGAQVPPELLQGAERASTFLRSPGGTKFAADLMDRWFNRSVRDVIDSPGVKSGVIQAKAIARKEGTDLYTALERQGLDPISIADRTKGRPDAIAIAMNAQTGKQLYDIDWFKADTGELHTEPTIWANNLAIAEQRGASPEVIAEIKRLRDRSRVYYKLGKVGDVPAFLRSAAAKPPNLVTTFLTLGILSSPLWVPRIFRL